MKKISLASADIPFRAYINIIDCLRTERIGRGKYVDLLEKKAADYFGVKHCLAVSSGTMADFIMLRTLKELYPEKNEVILPAFTFIAQANAVIWAGLKPVFVDVKENYQIDAFHVTGNTLCVFPAHLIGIFSDASMTKKAPVVEDCCEAMGGEYEWKKFGTFGIAGAFSMYPSHTITTGEGGLIITNDDEFARIARSIHNHGKRNVDFDFDYIGINAKMTNLQAAIGCELIDRIDEVNVKRRANIAYYNQLLGNDFRASAPHCYPIIYKTIHERDHALATLEFHGIEARKFMGCIPDSKPYLKMGYGGNYPNARRFANCGLFLPIHQNLTKEQIERVCHVLPKPR